MPTLKADNAKEIAVKRALRVLLLFVAVPALFAAPPTVSDPGELMLAVEEYGEPWTIGDIDDDGVADYAAIVNPRGVKFKEAVDYNRDGLMDDFYFYEDGILVREEIDSNFDGAIDIWVFMSEGIYIKEWRRDTDFDGEVDVQREYAEP